MYGFYVLERTYMAILVISQTFLYTEDTKNIKHKKFNAEEAEDAEDAEGQSSN